MALTAPVSDHVKTRGVVYFARMVDKIHLHAAGQLPPAYLGHLGLADSTSFDARFCRFWGLDYDQVKERTLKGGTAEEIFDELFAGRPPLNVEHVFVWNLFLLKRGWRDNGSAGVAAEKLASGFAHRTDAQTYVDIHDIEEGREPQAVLG